MPLKRPLILGSLAFALVLGVLSLLPGYGPAERDYQDESANVVGPLSYFKTPQSAVLTISQLLDEGNWNKLSQFYEQGQGAPVYGSLLDGTYYRAHSLNRPQVRPFPPEYVWRETRHSEIEDVYIVFVGRELMPETSEEGTGEKKNLKVLYLKRYPRGYRILPDPQAIPEPTAATAPLSD